MAITVNGLANGKVEPEVRLSAPFLLLDRFQEPTTFAPRETVLVALGLTIEGAPRFLALELAAVEDEESWRTFLSRLKAFAPDSSPLFVCSPGHTALTRAIQTTYPDAPAQISVVHRLLGLVRAADCHGLVPCLAEARRIFSASSRETAVARFREWRVRWLHKGRVSVRSLETDLASCLTFYRFPRHLWRKIRTVTLVGKTFRAALQSGLLGLPGLTDGQTGFNEASSLTQPEIAALARWLGQRRLGTVTRTPADGWHCRAIKFHVGGTVLIFDRVLRDPLPARAPALDLLRLKTPSPDSNGERPDDVKGESFRAGGLANVYSGSRNGDT